MGSTWSTRGSKDEREFKGKLLEMIKEHGVHVERPIPPAFCGPHFPFLEGSTCTCIELPEDDLPTFVRRYLFVTATRV